MARPSVEPQRRTALMNAAIKAIHQRGSLEVTMSEIASHAGVSPALAHHYFGGKEQLIVATMRHLLSELRRAAIVELHTARDPRERISAIVNACFSPEQFEMETISTWLTFYHHAQSSDPAARLLRVYFRRLHSNLAAALRDLLPPQQASAVAEGAAALIDGLYLRQGMKHAPPTPQSAIDQVERYIDNALAGHATA